MTISTRAEQAKPEEASGLLEELWEIHAKKLWAKGVPGIDRLASTFSPILDINTPEAHLAAAMMLVPEGYYEQISHVTADRWDVHLGYANRGPGRCGTGCTPALALIAAIARSIGQ